MSIKVEKLKKKRRELLEQCNEMKTQYIKNTMYRKIKEVNKQLFKETKNTIYL